MKQFLAIIFLGVAGYLAILLIEEGSAPPPKTAQAPGKNVSVNQEKYQEAVNRHLYETGLKLELQKERSQIEQVLPGREKNPEVVNRYDQASSGADRMDELVKKLSGSRAADAGVEQEIQSQLYEDQQNQEYSEAARRDYIDRFIRNARAGGYDIKVDYDTLKIKSVRRIQQ